MNNEEHRQHVFDMLQYRILTHYDEALMIREGKMPAPRTAIVYPTYVCNQNCTWCEYGRENNERPSMMSGDEFFRLMDDLRDLGVRGTEFCGGGEPTLHPVFAEVVRESKANGMSIGVLTNGTRCLGDVASALVDCASYVRVGFDGATTDTVNRVKRPRNSSGSFEAVCANVREMIALRAERGAPVPDQHEGCSRRDEPW